MPNPLKFRQNSSIGASDAILDGVFLEECFVDNGNLQMLQDTDDHHCIVLGRTGSGKSALLERMADRERHIRIEPEDLALSYVSNSQVLKYFSELGVDMDLFYRLLWRHVFIVEILKRHYDITSEHKRDTFLERLRSIFVNNKAKEEAINYVLEWGSLDEREIKVR